MSLKNMVDVTDILISKIMPLIRYSGRLTFQREFSWVVDVNIIPKKKLIHFMPMWPTIITGLPKHYVDIPFTETIKRKSSVFFLQHNKRLSKNDL